MSKVMEGERKTLLVKILALLKRILPLLPEECSGCGIFSKGILEYSLIDFRRKRVCCWCQANWLRKEDTAGHKLSFDDYTNKGTK